MIPTDLLQRAASAVSSTLNRYSLLIPSCPSPLDVENLTGMEALSENYLYSVMFTSPDKDITPEQMLRKAVTLTMGTGSLLELKSQKIVHGYITDFRRLTGSADQVSYLVIIEPRFSLLDKQFRSHRFFVNKSVPEVVSQILDEHGFQGWEYEFSLKHDYPKREQINQYQESDLKFIQRLLSEIGIFYYFTLQPDTQTEVVRFGDAQSAYSDQKSLPLNSPSGLEDNAQESVWHLNLTHNVVEAGVTAKDYNHREAQRVLRSVKADMTRGDGENISYGEVYHYRPRHPYSGDKFAPETETANFYARLDHERFLARQTLIFGICNDAFISPGHVLSVTETGIPTLPAQLQSPVLITQINVSASRRSAFQATLNAVPYSETLCWRPALLARPKVSGTMTARVTSAKDNDIYAWQDASGLYRVVFDADEEGRERGLESMPVRLAKPYGGDMYGFHFPLIQGTEVAIAFREGDPDQPYIAHALHDSRHVDHVTEKNSTRNVIRTAGLNKLRMEDKRGEEHIKLSTEYGGKTQLNLGHNVSASRELRGEGAELRTDKHIAIRGGSGVFISADRQPKSQGNMLDMNTAIAELQSALQMVTALAQSTQTSGALESDAHSQQKLAEALNQLKDAGILLSAPAGIAAATASNIQLSSGQSLTATAGKNVDMSIVKRFTVAAGEAISLFAHRMGLKVYAAKGDVDIQAQTDAMRLQANKNLAVNSISGEIILNASRGITLTSKGGAYIKIKDGSVEIGAPSRISLKSGDIAWGGNASLETALSAVAVSDPQFTNTMNGRFRVLDQATQQPKAYIPYRIESADGQILRGVTDEQGYTQAHYGLNEAAISLHYE
ncbi:type VI secretion system tip protein VgrG [Pantoea sp. Al-1710]|uniref:Type VI secretion system tip protein VgrG n=1 Tax=Candidatus Pantoea communis TaxID=2608354 RepID=A0ABX0RNW0_9GAMM|nr:type VI secretion system tip protein VgrG [Pantoea communis]NIG18266.1 type VI secretion system tip protein VgrG [Pantoea communis]